LIKIGGGTMSLNNANTFSGTMAVNVGTLKLGASGSINDATDLTLAANTTFDVSAINSFVLSTSTTLTASGAATAATIKGAVSGTVSLGAQPIHLTFTPTTFSGDLARPALKVSQSALILDNNTFTVTNAAATPLDAGVYRLIQVGDGSTGSITENATPSYLVTVGGAGLALGTTATVSVSSGNVILTVEAGAGYSDWADANAPGQSPGEDHDDDGVKNGIEYFMGQSGSSFTSNPGLDENHKIIWPKDPAFNGTWQVETSPNLINWTDVAATDLGTSVEYTLPGGMGTLFVRLVVTPN